MTFIGRHARTRRPPSPRGIPAATPTHPDAQIAAIAKVHKAKVATGNVADFLGMGLELVDPWANTR